MTPPIKQTGDTYDKTQITKPNAMAEPHKQQKRKRSHFKPVLQTT